MSKLAQLKAIIPKLTPQLHKGQCGRLAVIGGCQDYTGAPYFSAIASMALGCDLVHVITTRDAATVIKGYSPDLMVHPYLEEEKGKESDLDKCIGLLERMDAVVIGPGMGRNIKLRDDIKEIMEYLLGKAKKPVVLDADALFHLSTNSGIRDLVKNSESSVILTPNIIEFRRLAESEGVDSIQGLSKVLGCTVIQKGTIDLISIKGSEPIEVNEPGSLKRVGGQGDTLTGILGTLLCWGVNYQGGKESIDEIISIVCFGGCYLTRKTCYKAFEKYGRSMLTSSIHLSINEVWVEFYGTKN